MRHLGGYELWRDKYSYGIEGILKDTILQQSVVLVNVAGCIIKEIASRRQNISS